MRRLSKIAAVALVGALALAGCGSGSGSGSSDSGGDAKSSSNDACKAAKGDGPKVGLAYDVGGRGDQSFNDSAYKGMEKAIADIDATCIEAKAAPDENDTIRAERLRTLAEGGYNPVIAIGFIYSPAAATVAAEYPETNFAVIDGYSTTHPEGAAEEPERPGLRRGAGLLPGRCGRGAEVRRPSTSASSAAPTVT